MKIKFEQLEKKLEELSKDGICVAFSGGVDSTLLLYMAKNYNACALTFKSEFQNDDEIKFCEEFCKEHKIKHKILDFNPTTNPILSNNPNDRCYHCKKIIFEKALEFGKENNIKHVLDGTNFDDLSSYRPGLVALEELKISSLFAEFKIGKKEIREYSKILGLKIHDKPSNPCFATRFPYGQKLNEKDIETVEKAEKILYDFGFKNNRARLHKDILRIEIEKTDFMMFHKNEEEILKSIKELNVRYVTLDLEGLRVGSMD